MPAFIPPSRQRQADGKNCALANPAAHIQPAVVAFHDFPRLVGSDAEAALFGGAERLEQIVADELLRPAAAAVRHLHAGVPVPAIRLHLDRASLRRGVDGVLDQVGEHLLQPPRIPTYYYSRSGAIQSNPLV